MSDLLLGFLVCLCLDGFRRSFQRLLCRHRGLKIGGMVEVEFYSGTIGDVEEV